MNHSLSRRHFLTTATTLAGTAVSASALTWVDEPGNSPNEKLHIGVNGVDGQGRYNWGELLGTKSEIVALCDVDESRSVAARKRLPKAKFFSDYRTLIDSKSLDAVLIATPDHNHAPAAYRALQANLHVYCEKPLTHTVAEARILAETAKKMKRVTQMGTQIHASNNYRRVVEAIQASVIGPVTEVHVWVGKSWGGEGSVPKETPKIPDTLKWDLWLGPAKERAYHPIYTHGGDWRRWWDFGGGTLADMACHFCDLPFWALNLKAPTKIQARGPKLNPDMAAMWLEVEYDFPARGELPSVQFHWYDGGKKPILLKEKKLPDWESGVLFIGKEGMMLANYGGFQVFYNDPKKTFSAPKESIPNSIGHHREWVEACKTGGLTTCNFGYSGALTEAVLLGVVSFRLGTAIEWDSEKLKVTNIPEAEKLIQGEHRKGWEVGII